MEFITLIPGVICIIVLLWGRTQDAFLNVFLPVLLLIPVDYSLTVRPIPPVTMLVAVLLPLAVGMIFHDLHRWRFTRTDLWILLLFFSKGFADYKSGQTSAAILAWFVVLTTGLIPYMAGKLLIEQADLRTKTVSRFVWLLLLSCPISVIESIKKSNPFQDLWSLFYPGQRVWETSIRWGLGRLAGPFSQSELAGMVLLTGLIFAFWLGNHSYKDEANQGYWQLEGTPAFPRRIPRLTIAVLIITLVLTLARGPWIGALLGLSIAWIGRDRQPKQRALLVFALILSVGLPVYLLTKDYVSGPRTEYGSERETAQYRAQLIENYLPIAKAGGAWGWGVNGFSVMDDQVSIDNEYLFLYLAQGYVGVGAFILLLAETTTTLLRRGFRSRSDRDRYFIFSLLGIVLGISFTISTVFLGSQNYEILFMIIGWSQAIRPVTKNAALEASGIADEVKLTSIRVYS